MNLDKDSLNIIRSYMDDTQIGRYEIKIRGIKKIRIIKCKMDLVYWASDCVCFDKNFKAKKVGKKYTNEIFIHKPFIRGKSFNCTLKYIFGDLFLNDTCQNCSFSPYYMPCNKKISYSDMTEILLGCKFQLLFQAIKKIYAINSYQYELRFLGPLIMRSPNNIHDQKGEGRHLS